jgi:hypothetical protein
MSSILLRRLKFALDPGLGRFHGVVLSQTSQAKIVPAVVIRPVNGPWYFGQLSEGNRRGTAAGNRKPSSLSVVFHTQRQIRQPKVEGNTARAKAADEGSARES